MDGRAKITDFGIAKVLAREGVARTVGVMGTPSYMSPEQVKGGEIDARTDIFSLGIIIFTMLAGRKPFLGNTAAVMFKIVYEEPPAPSSLNPQLTPAHDYVVKKCLAKDRNLRYSSARDLLGDLDDLQHGRAPRSQAMAPAPAAPAVPAAAPRLERTLAMPTPGVMKPAPSQPLPRPSPPPRQPAAAPPPKPVTPPPIGPVQAAGPAAPPPSGATLNMPIPGLIKGAPQPLVVASVFRASRFTAHAGATAQARHAPTGHAGALPERATFHGTNRVGPFHGAVLATGGARAFRIQCADADGTDASRAAAVIARGGTGASRSTHFSPDGTNPSDGGSGLSGKASRSWTATGYVRSAPSA